MIWKKNMEYEKPTGAPNTNKIYFITIFYLKNVHKKMHIRLRKCDAEPTEISV